MKTTADNPLVHLHQLSLYNTGRISPEQVVAAFAARRSQLDRILADLTAEKKKSRPQHHLIVGQRGMGKTMLLARIAAELKIDTELRKRFIPLTFAEEQYAVNRLSKFWLNCLDSLADARESEGEDDAVDAIDATVKRLTSGKVPDAKNDQPFADEVYAAFAKAAQVSGQRPVLLVDNLQIVFERLEQDQQHSLRELLMRPGAPILIGASPSPPPSSQDYGAAFYDQFKVHYLRPLDEGEMRDLMLHLADASGREDVRRRVQQQPGRLTVLRQLTGGNPRTTLTLFFLYAEDFAPTVFGDLENLLDRVTPLYKARFEELTPQQQVVTSAIANHWDPVTAATLAQNTALPAATISSQLDRLEKAGTVEQVELFGENRKGYQIAERFFNIWFLMRSASRRQRREVEFLTRFLENFYAPPERRHLARHLMGENHFSPDRYILSESLAATLEKSGDADDLRRHNELVALREKEAEARRRMRELIDFDALPPATLSFDALRSKLISLVPEEAKIAPEEFAKAVLGDRAMFMSGEREQLAAKTGTLSAEVVDQILETVTRSRRIDAIHYSAEAIGWFSHRLASGQIRGFRDVEDWNRAFDQTEDRDCHQLMVETIPDGFGAHLDTEILDMIQKKLRPSSSADAMTWLDWGYNLHIRLSQHSSAEAAYREAIARDINFALPWNNLAVLLSDHLGRHEEAEAAFREAIDRDPELAVPWNGLGNLLRSRLGRYEEAEAAFREAIAHDSNYALPWNNLAVLLSDHLGRHEEAEAAFREAIARDPELAVPWNGLGNLLRSRLGRYEEAEAAFREAIAHDSNYAMPWNNLAVLLSNHLGRHEEAEAAFREAIARDPDDASAWNNLGNLLNSHLGRYEEAETNYREAIARDPYLAAPWNGLGNLFADHFGRFSEAYESFAKALELDAKNPLIMQNRLFLSRDYLVEDTATARQWMDEILALPEHQFPDTCHLHEALFAAYERNWGLACDALEQAIAIRSEGFNLGNTDDWLRASAVLIHLNYGAELLTFLDDRGDTARLRPWVEALRAVHAGDRSALQNVAPEIRSTAEVFYDGIEKRLAHLPESTGRRPKPAIKRARRRK